MAKFNQAEFLRESARRGLFHFHKAVWKLYEPGTELISNWHLGAMCEFLEAFLKDQGQSKYWVMNVPPGSGKSSVGGITSPTWAWTWDPGFKFMFGSFDIKLLEEQSRKTHLVMNDLSYKTAFPHTRLTSNKPALGKYTLTGGGLRTNIPRGGKGTGQHAHVGIIDDPLSAQEGFSETSMVDALSWIQNTLPSRGADPNTFRIMQIMQRLSLGDPAEYYLEQTNVEHLMLPMEYVPNAFWDRGNSVGVKDIRKKPGELLFPLRWNKNKVDELRHELKGEAEAQMQQNPVDREGGIVPENALRFEWIDVPTRARLCQSWDFSAKGTKLSHSRVAGGLFASGVTQEVSELLNSIQERSEAKGKPDFRHIPCNNETRFFLLDYRVNWMNYKKSKRIFKEMSEDELWRKARVKLLEEAASGIQLIQDMQGIVSGIRAVTPKGSKEERWRVHSDSIGSGLLLMPPDSRVPKLKDRIPVDEFRVELINFPRGNKDDCVDITSQALDFLDSKRGRKTLAISKAAANITKSDRKRWRRTR